MRYMLFILTFLLFSCGSDSNPVSPFGPEALIGDWEIQKLEYRSYFDRGIMPGEQDKVVTLNEPVSFEAPTVSGAATFNGQALSIDIMLVNINLTSVAYQYTAENGVIEIALAQNQKITWGFTFSEGSLILLIPDLPGNDYIETKLYYKKKQ